MQIAYLPKVPQEARGISVQEYMLVSLGEELVVLGTSRTFLESPLRVIALYE